MTFKELFRDDEAVSPVIGVILMVAITVILAAVIATFVLGLGEQISSNAPQASFDYELDSGELTITHTGGDTLSASEISISVNGNNVSDGGDYDFVGSAWSDDIGAGDSVTIEDTRDSLDSSDTVRIIWSSSDGDQTAILSEW